MTEAFHCQHIREIIMRGIILTNRAVTILGIILHPEFNIVELHKNHQHFLLTGDRIIASRKLPETFCSLTICSGTAFKSHTASVHRLQEQACRRRPFADIGGAYRTGRQRPVCCHPGIYVAEILVIQQRISVDRRVQMIECITMQTYLKRAAVRLLHIQHTSSCRLGHAGHSDCRR